MAKRYGWESRFRTLLFMAHCLGVMGLGCSDGGSGTTGASGSSQSNNCEAPLLLCGEACIDPQVDEANCGMCGTTCAMTEQCTAGSCEPICMAGLTLCGASCVDTSSDATNCGMCGTTCAMTEQCTAGSCEPICMAGLTLCGTTCVDTTTDATNCGMCGTTCAMTEKCTAGSCEPICMAGLTLCGTSCVDTSTDASNCGMCGTICAMGAVCSMSMCGAPPATYFKASNTGVSDAFGLAVAISADGNTLAISGYADDSNATGINGNQADDSAADSGAVYIFTRNAGVWSQQAYIKASNTGAGDRFGLSISLSADGNTLAVGASDEDSGATGINGNGADDSVLESGAAYVFTRSAGVWSQQAYIKASNPGNGDYFGASVAISGDGNTLAVGARYEDSNAVGVGGSQNNDLAMNAGAAYMFVRNAGIWSQQAYIKASNAQAHDWFGWTVSVSNDGNTLAVGAQSEDSNALGINGNQIDNSAMDAGAAYVYVRSGNVWSQQAYIKASNSQTNDRFGYIVGLSGDGTTLAVGAPYEDSNALGINGNQGDNSAADSGATYVYALSGGVWSQQAYVKASNTDAGDNFGWFVSFTNDGNTLAVGAIQEDSNATGINGNQSDNSVSAAGATYLLARSGGIWSHQTYVKASNTGADDWFGRAGALSSDGKSLVVGAYLEDSNATGINGNQSDNSANNSGAAYLYSF